MIKHLFKLIWRRKWNNFLLITEIAISALVLFAVYVLGISNFQTFFSPTGFKDDNVWLLDFDKTQGAKTDSIFMNSVKQQIAGIQGIEEVSFTTTNAPFMVSHKILTEVNAEGRKKSIFLYQTDTKFSNVLSMPILAGKWFTQGDLVGKYIPVVVNESLKKEIYPNENIIGKIVTIDKKMCQVIGLIGAYKVDHEFQSPTNAVFMPLNQSEIGNARLILKIREGDDNNLEAKLYNSLVNLSVGVKPNIEKLTKKRLTQRKLNMTPIIIVGSICGFLIINVILGLFSVFWQNISKRREEIGLRRAIGATASGITKQFVGEALIISTFALLISLLLMIQFPLMNIFDVLASTYWWSILLTLISIYTLISLSALYPSRQASLIQPSEALAAE
jgi:putative ABC transport system permease protein